MHVDHFKISSSPGKLNEVISQTLAFEHAIQIYSQCQRSSWFSLLYKIPSAVVIALLNARNDINTNLWLLQHLYSDVLYIFNDTIIIPQIQLFNTLVEINSPAADPEKISIRQCIVCRYFFRIETIFQNASMATYSGQ